ncbi:basic amino acid ABC transporter substrate-binding protein [Bacillus horti]|uniref:Polar amino acid transport system substrate-binding protein n=1 Tax=Caldalkalibacillus horti TaxID=77523 RepID=A0ABT9W400_9BACI|nr:basic amino acid ABC transporter substrate-binding protein [Bacillus horti]MDQ0167976.1 polar amino acid transport system substrate-binding protein [Bacillus horti]
MKRVWKGKLGFLVVALLLVLVAAGCGQDSSDGQTGSGEGNGSGEATQKLVVGTDAAYAPFEYVEPSGDIAGFDIDILSAIAEEENLELDFQNTAWEGIFLALQNGERDVLISAVTITEERQQDMDFTDSYFEATQLIAVPADSDIESFADLEGKKVGVQTGTTGDIAVSGLLGATSNDINRYESTPVALMEMVNQGIDAVVADNVVILEYIKNNPDANFKSIHDDSFDVENYGIVVKKGNTELLDTLNSGLAKIKENGKYDEIYSKYFGEEPGEE